VGWLASAETFVLKTALLLPKGKPCRRGAPKAKGKKLQKKKRASGAPESTRLPTKTLATRKTFNGSQTEAARIGKKWRDGLHRGQNYGSRPAREGKRTTKEKKKGFPNEQKKIDAAETAKALALVPKKRGRERGSEERAKQESIGEKNRPRRKKKAARKRRRKKRRAPWAGWAAKKGAGDHESSQKGGLQPFKNRPLKGPRKKKKDRAGEGKGRPTGRGTKCPKSHRATIVSLRAKEEEEANGPANANGNRVRRKERQAKQASPHWKTSSQL